MKEQLSVVLVALGIAALFAAGAGVLIHKRSLNAAAEESAFEPPPEPTPVATVPPIQPLPVVAAAPLAAATEAPTPSPKDARLFDRARELMLDGRSGEAKTLLEARGVRRGAGTIDEARLLKALCQSARDRSCTDDLKSSYPTL